MPTKGVVPPQFQKAKKSAPSSKAPAKPMPSKSAPPFVKKSTSGDAVTKGDVSLLKSILTSEKIPAQKAAVIVDKFKAGNT